jgi:hypothetical protein
VVAGAREQRGLVRGARWLSGYRGRRGERENERRDGAGAQSGAAECSRKQVTCLHQHREGERDAL